MNLDLCARLLEEAEHRAGAGAGPHPDWPLLGAAALHAAGSLPGVVFAPGIPARQARTAAGVDARDQAQRALAVARPDHRRGRARALTRVHDSEHAYRTIATRGHVALALGTAVRAGKLATANDAQAPAKEEPRLLTPVSFQFGYRGKFKASERAGLEKLVRHELARHASHDWAEQGCEARLRVELISVGGERHLTGWLEGEVPHRVTVGGDGLAPAMEELLSVVLHNDPRRLRGPQAEQDLFATGVRALRLNGQTYVGVEAYALGAWVGDRAQTLSGLGAFLRREVGSVHVAVRFAGAHDFGERSELRLSTDVVAEVEAALWSSSTADTAAFAALSLGYEYQRFAGPAPLAGPGAHASASASGFSPSLRVGVELFRVTRTRALFFLAARAPASSAATPTAAWWTSGRPPSRWAARSLSDRRELAVITGL